VTALLEEDDRVLAPVHRAGGDEPELRKRAGAAATWPSPTSADRMRIRREGPSPERLSGMAAHSIGHERGILMNP
jgi:hypothetical protein